MSVVFKADRDWRDVGRPLSCNAFAIATFSSDCDFLSNHHAFFVSFFCTSLNALCSGVTDKDSTSSDDSCRSLRVPHVLPIFEILVVDVLYVLLFKMNNSPPNVSSVLMSQFLYITFVGDGSTTSLSVLS